MLEANITLNVGLPQPEIFKALIAYFVPDPIHGGKTGTDWLAFSNNVRARLGVVCNSAPGTPYPCVTIHAQADGDKMELLKVYYDTVERLKTYGLKNAEYVATGEVTVRHMP